MAHITPPLRPPLRSLEIAVVVSQCGSLTGAAEALGLTHGAVSRQVKALEAVLGLRLFDRHGRGVRPTVEGQRYLNSVARSLDAIDSASERWYQRRGRHVVRVGVTPTFAYLWLLRNIPALQEGEPSLRVEVNAEAGFADIEHGEVDCVIRYTREDLAPPRAQRLFGERLRPVGTRDFAAELGPDADPEAILSRPLLHDTDATKWRAWARDASGGVFRPAPHDRKFENYLLTLEAARSGLGIALGQDPVARGIVEQMGLVPLSSIETASPLSYFLVTRPGELQGGVPVFLDRLSRLLVGTELAFAP